MKPTLIRIVKTHFETDFDVIFRKSFNLAIVDKYRYENYDCTLTLKKDQSGFNFVLTNGETGEILVDIGITPCILPTLPRFIYRIEYVAEDFNHARKYTDGVIHTVCNIR